MNKLLLFLGLNILPSITYGNDSSLLQMSPSVAEKTALITGITGQDGRYLAEFLLEKRYRVYGTIRHTATNNTENIEILLNDESLKQKFMLIEMDLTDNGSIIRALLQSQPDEVYNLGAQSFVGHSFNAPEYTAQVDGLGALRILESIKNLGWNKKVKYYQASTSEMYGLVQQIPQTETTPFSPRSPYAVAKLFAYWTTVNYRDAYGIYACNGILFNHESPIRGAKFVTRKITKSLAEIKCGLKEVLLLGNLDAMRDWGHAKDYVQMMWKMLQQEKPEDFVIATGEQHSVREFITLAAKYLDMEINFNGDGLEEVGVDETGKIIVRVSPEFFRPSEVETLLGCSEKAKEKLCWEPTTKFEDLVKEMALNDLEKAKIRAKIRDN